MIRSPVGGNFALQLGLFAVLLVLPTCGAGSEGGPGPDGAGQGLVLVKFMQANTSTVPINQRLEFRFSEAVDPDTVNVATVQIREGPGYGISVAGEFTTDGAVAYFSPVLPTLCDKSDAGLKPGTTYRVIILGAPEEFAVENSVGQALDRTSTHEFRTLPESDPDHLHDQIPGTPPAIRTSEPEPGSAAVCVAACGEITIEFTENVDPCSLRLGDSVLLKAYERGDPNTFLEAPSGRLSGFDPVQDAVPDDPYTWGASGTTILPPRLISAEIELVQSIESTVVHVRPLAGAFPENVLVVLDLTHGVLDFGGSPLTPRSIDFTTENVDGFHGELALEYDETTPIDLSGTSADVNTPRSPGRAQAWLAFTGDGDNGTDAPHTLPAFPTLDAGGDYVEGQYRDNDGEEDELIVESTLTFNTGNEITPSSDANDTDASSASVWEFRRVEIRPGGVLRLVGANPAIFVVKEDVVIQTGGRVEAYGGNGVNSQQGGAAGPPCAGGTARLGGGNGGRTPGSDNSMGSTARGYSNAPLPPTSWDGFAPYGSPEYGVEGGEGAGEGGSSGTVSGTYCQTTGGGQGGGGGGHGEAGADAEFPAWAGSTWDVTNAGDGGGAVPDFDNSMRKPSAGGGGGGGGTETFYAQNSTGGGGGAGGGFVGFTAGGDITVNGTIDVHGGNGGLGGWDDDNACNGSHSGGGGGGAGGGIRLLSGGDINIGGATLDASGGQPGLPGCKRGGAKPTWSGPVAAWGADGRIVMEDRDGFIEGAPAYMEPSSPNGLYATRLDPSRFPSGGGGGAGGAATALTFPVPLGTILDPSTVVIQPLEEADLDAGIPSVASPTDGSASIVVELQGFPANPDGTLDETSPTGWYAVGYFETGTSETQPRWTSDRAPAGFAVDAGEGVSGVAGSAFLQVRLSLIAIDGMTPTDPGPYVDRMVVRYTYDN